MVKQMRMENSSVSLAKDIMDDQLKKKSFQYTMVDKTFCKQALEYFLWCGAVGITSFIVSKNIKRIRDEYRVRKALWQLKEALEKSIENSKVIEVIQTLEDLEKEIKASQDEKMLRHFEALIKNIKALPEFQLKE